MAALLPLIHALKKATDEEKATVSSLLRERRITDGDLQWVREFLDHRGGVTETLNRSRKFLQKATASLEVFPESEEKRALMQLAERILHRTY